MTASLFQPVNEAWPPFPVDQLPRAVRGLFEDFRRAGLHSHPAQGDGLLTVVVPCFNPDPQQFAQLLLSIQLQADQRFNLLLVNDGSSPEAWAPIAQLLAPLPWVQVLHQPANAGISAALNRAIESLGPAPAYVALVDQDDLLHPAAIAEVRRHLQSHPDCGLLYSDHVTFDAAGRGCQYVPKAPWNPEVLLEFNQLIHLTVVRTDLYRACGGMNPRYDGIQDWEFYLRLAPLLSAETVGYLPLPLYAWRLSDQSRASSAQPRPELLALAQEFLELAHQRMGGVSRPVSPGAGPGQHYRFRVDREASTAAAAQACNLLLLVGEASPREVWQSLNSLVEAPFCLAKLFIALDAPSDVAFDIPAVLPQPHYLCGSVRQLFSHLPSDGPLLVLQAGACLQAGAVAGDLAGWLLGVGRWDLLTLACFNQADGRCVSAGYARAIEQQHLYLPLAQGIDQAEYEGDFASFAHTRPVDLPSPSVQLLTPTCVQRTLEVCAGDTAWAERSLSEGWWPLLASQPWRCCCLPDLALLLPPRLAMAEQHHVALRRDQRVSLVTAQSCFAAEPQPWPPSYGGLLRAQLAYGPGRCHPLHLQDWVSEFLHPSQLLAATSAPTRLSLLPLQPRQTLLILIPTELNPRSHGHACMLTLALQLQKAGQPVALLPFKPYTFFRHFHSKLHARYQQLRFVADLSEVPEATLLVPESAPPSLVRQLRARYGKVLWWLLAPSGLLTDFRPDIRRGDRLVAFSEFTLPGQPRYLFVHPKPKLLWRRFAAMHVPQAPRPQQVALYTGKGRLKPLPRSLHRYLLAHRVVLITRTFPSSKAGLLRLLVRSNGLISFDPMTNLSLEAATLGVPTYLPGNPFPARCYRNFPADLRAHITDSPGAFMTLLQQPGPVRQLPIQGLFRETAKAADLVSLFTIDPEPLAAQPFVVDDDLLQQLHNYHRELSRSLTIQTARDGEAISSAFIGFYLLTLKSPYFIHYSFCTALHLLDRMGDAIFAVGLYPLLKPLINWMGARVQAMGRRFGRFGRIMAA